MAWPEYSSCRETSLLLTAFKHQKAYVWPSGPLLTPYSACVVFCDGLRSYQLLLRLHALGDTLILPRSQRDYPLTLMERRAALHRNVSAAMGPRLRGTLHSASFCPQPATSPPIRQSCSWPRRGSSFDGPSGDEGSELLMCTKGDFHRTNRLPSEARWIHIGWNTLVLSSWVWQTNSRSTRTRMPDASLDGLTRRFFRVSLTCTLTDASINVLWEGGYLYQSRPPFILPFNRSAHQQPLPVHSTPQMIYSRLATALLAVGSAVSVPVAKNQNQKRAAGITGSFRFCPPFSTSQR